MIMGFLARDREDARPDNRPETQPDEVPPSEAFDERVYTLSPRIHELERVRRAAKDTVFETWVGLREGGLVVGERKEGFFWEKVVFGPCPVA